MRYDFAAGGSLIVARTALAPNGSSAWKSNVDTVELAKHESAEAINAGNMFASRRTESSQPASSNVVFHSGDA